MHLLCDVRLYLKVQYRVSQKTLCSKVSCARHFYPVMPHHEASSSVMHDTMSATAFFVPASISCRSHSPYSVALGAWDECENNTLIVVHVKVGEKVT